MKTFRPGSQTERACDILRQLAIQAGPGGQLPAYRDLLAQIGVSGATLSAALQALEDENLIQRIQGSGIYVRRDIAQVRWAILVDPHFFISYNSSPFWALLIRAIQVEAKAQGEEGEIHFVYLGNEEDEGLTNAVPDSLHRFMRLTTVRGAIAIGMSYGGFQMFSRYNRPISGYAGYGEPMVDDDHHAFVSQCLIAAQALGATEVFGWDFAESSGNFRTHWRRVTSIPFCPIGPVGPRGKATVENPYDTTLIGLQTAETVEVEGHPTFIAQDDMLASGFLMGMLRRGLEPGRDFELITHSNTGSNVLAAWKDRICRVEYDPSDIARGLLAPLRAVTQGHSVPPVISEHVRRDGDLISVSPRLFMKKA